MLLMMVKKHSVILVMEMIREMATRVLMKNGKEKVGDN